MGAVAETIRRKLEGAFAPAKLEVTDQSDKHAGHSGAREGGESHFDVVIEAAAFQGVARVQRQRKIYGVLAEELAGPIHALSVKASAPGEN
jgi:BolA protein